MSDEGDPHPLARAAWRAREPGQLIGRGHPAGDFLEAWRWEVLEEAEGRLRIRAHVPEHVRNPRGQLFGGFTPTYVDLVALFTFRAGRAPDAPRSWLATVSMKIDYLAPIVGDGVEIESAVVGRRGRMAWVDTRFLAPEGDLLVLAQTTLREVE